MFHGEHHVRQFTCRTNCEPTCTCRSRSSCGWRCHVICWKTSPWQQGWDAIGSVAVETTCRAAVVSGGAAPSAVTAANGINRQVSHLHGARHDWWDYQRCIYCTTCFQIYRYTHTHLWIRIEKSGWNKLCMTAFLDAKHKSCRIDFYEFGGWNTRGWHVVTFERLYFDAYTQ